MARTCALTLLLIAMALSPRSALAAAAAPGKSAAAKKEADAKAAAAPKADDKAAAVAPVPVAQSALRGPQRIDFDDRLVQGQTNKLGAVYLYQRKDPAQSSLLERRKSFREEIAKDLVE